MRLSDLLAAQPKARAIPGAREAIRRQLLDSGKRLVVVDDDPTGTQTVHDVPVYLNWSVDALRRSLTSADPVLYVSTNSRSLSEADAMALSLDLGRNLASAASAEGVALLIASRSDSTLRGHFPAEVDAMAAGLGQEPDGIVLAPAFFEAGRYTIGDVHWVQQGDTVVSAEQTEFARDPSFGYKHGNLREWVDEKTRGRVRAEEVLSVSLQAIRRGGIQAVECELMKASGALPIVANAACYEDLEVLALALAQAEVRGKRFMYRCAACFVKARGGIGDRPLLRGAELASEGGPCLVVVGSHVEKTSRQLDALLGSGLADGVELRVERLLDVHERDGEIIRAAQAASRSIIAGQSVAVYTSRTRLPLAGEAFLEAGKAIMECLCGVARRIEARPGSLVAKGGITSIEVARSALGVTEARVLGQVLEGVPVWDIGPESRWPGVPYVVFPGNVGDENALRQVVATLLGLGGGER